MSDDHAALRAFAGEGGIAWPEGDGIESRPGKLGGSPCIAGTRLAVEQVAAMHETFATADLLAMFPDLTPPTVRQAIAYREDHAALYRAAAWRYQAEVEDAEAGAALVAAVRALLAERDRLAALAGEVHAEIAAYLAHHDEQYGAHAAHLSVPVAYGDLHDWRDALAAEAGAGQNAGA